MRANFDGLDDLPSPSSTVANESGEDDTAENLDNRVRL
jgi:hypothetical protein